MVLLAWFCGRFSRPQCGTAFGWRATPRTVAWVAVRALQVAAAGVTFAATAVRTDTPPWTPCMQVLFDARGPSDLGPQRCPSRTSLFSLVPNSGFSMRASNSAIVTLCQQPAPCCSFQPCLSSFWPPPHRILVSAPGRFPADYASTFHLAPASLLGRPRPGNSVSGQPICGTDFKARIWHRIWSRVCGLPIIFQLRNADSAYEICPDSGLEICPANGGSCNLLSRTGSAEKRSSRHTKNSNSGRARTRPGPMPKANAKARKTARGQY